MDNQSLDFGRAFRLLRAAVNIRQCELAEGLSIKASQVSLIESNKRRPSVETVEEVARFFCVRPDVVTILATPSGNVGELDERAKACALTELLRTR